MTTAETVISLLGEVTGVDQVRRDPDLRLYDREILDSLGTVELIVAFEEAFRLEISPAELERSMWATPALMVADIERRLHG